MHERARQRLVAREAEIVEQLQALTRPDRELSRAALVRCLGESEPIIVERRTAAATQDNLQELLDEVRHARARLEEGGYGTCEVCGEPIPEGRLEARPWATRCVQHS